MRAIKTPPSLKWLINKRARLHGELLALQKAQPKQLSLLNERALSGQINRTLISVIVYCVALDHCFRSKKLKHYMCSNITKPLILNRFFFRQ